MSSGRGTRSSFIRSLLESTTSSDEKKESADSGLHSRTPDTTPPQTRKPAGRGAIREETSSGSEQTSSSSAPAMSRGRASFIQNLYRTTGESAAASSVSPPVRPSGRGQFLRALLQEPEEPKPLEETVVTAVTQQMEKLQVAPTVQESSVITTQTEDREPLIKMGTKGRPVQITSNYIRLKFEPDKGIFEYEVRFDPNVDSSNIRFKYLNEHRNVIGNTKTFDGVKLYVPERLKQDETILNSNNPADGSPVQIRIIFKRKHRMGENIHLYNVLFKRIMKILELVEFGRKHFDPSDPKIIPQYKLEIWPGYVTAVDEYEGGMMLCLDVSHRVLLKTTVLDHIRLLHRGNLAEYKSNVHKSLLGSVVLTRYNNRTYRIDDIVFDQTPASEFTMRGETMTYMQYYKKQYNIDILDSKQPLLVHRAERRVSGQEKPQEIILCLIPEICFLTGLTDDMRSDFKVMREIATYTRVTPNQRLYSMQQFCRRVNESPEAKDVLKQWGLSLDESPVKLNARYFDEEKIIFKTTSAGGIGVGPNGDFNSALTRHQVLDAINLSNWVLIHCQKDGRTANLFMDCAQRNGKPMGIDVNKPLVKVLQSDRTDTFVEALRETIRPGVQIVVIIVPNMREDRYSAIKKICCAENPIPSQVINSKTLANEAKARAIVQKIILQMNCKLGGTLWSIKIPFDNVMIAGIDTYHDPKQKSNSVSAFIASMNGEYTRWYSRACIQSKKEEFMNGLCSSLLKSLEAYKKMNGVLPSKIVIFRDGVGDGQLRMVEEYEIPQMRAACQMFDKEYDPPFTFVVVQKRINTRMFKMEKANELSNPLPGTVLDHTITRRYLFDYFLVPQNVRQGTVTPTHYIVVNDTAQFSPDILQRLSYKLCYLYYNWPGSVRVPACCQYAHKLAYLIGQSVRKNPAEKLNDKLFFL